MSFREQKIREAMFPSSRGILPDDRSEIKSLVEKEFNLGQNIYLLDFHAFMSMILPLLGEMGRRKLLEQIGSQLDMFADLADRQGWAAGLQSL